MSELVNPVSQLGFLAFNSAYQASSQFQLLKLGFMEPRRNLIAVLDAGNLVLICKDYPAFGGQTFPTIPDISGCALPQVGNQKLCLYGCVLVLDEMDQGRTKKTNWKTGSSQQNDQQGASSYLLNTQKKVIYYCYLLDTGPSTNYRCL